MDRTITAAIAVIVVAVVAIVIFSAAGTGTGFVQNAQAAGTTPQQTGTLGNSNGNSGGTATAATGNGEVQTFFLSSKGNQYSPAEIRVKLGTKVRIEGDPATLVGCMNTVNIDGYGISKLIRNGDNVIEFTADKAGTFPIHCNMGIGNGKLVVEDSSGAVPVQSEAPALAQGSGGCCG